MTGKSPDDHRPSRWRKLRSIAVLTATALAAPLGFVAATTSPASAAPVTVRVSGDPATVNGGQWVWGGTHYSQLRGLLASTNFGAEVSFSVDNGGVTPAQLNDSIDVFFSGATSYTPTEQAQINNWIQAGGVYIGNRNHEYFDNTSFLPGGGAAVRGVVAQWEEQSQPDPPVDPALPDTHTCQMHVPAGSCVGINLYAQKHSAPAPATVQNAGNPTVSALVNGPHGNVSSIRNWHTVTVFTSVPVGAVEVARLNVTCTEATAACSGSPLGSFAYNNTINGAVVSVVPFGTAGYGAGAAVLTGDGDVFSNAYGPMEEGNQRLALNTFRWIGEHLADLADPPTTPPTTPTTPPTTPPLDPGQCRASTNPAPAASPASGQGYWFLGRNGDVYNFGNTTDFGGLPDIGVSTPAAAMSARADGTGYWVVDRAGIVHAFGGAAFHGDMRGVALNAPIIALEPTRSGNGYWLLAGDGGVFSFGDAQFFGSTGGMRLNAPIISMRAHPHQDGYWLLAADGGVFTFGDAQFHGSTGSMTLNAPVLSMAVHPSGNGYWLLGGDGGVFSFGAVGFHGSVPGIGLCNGPTAVQIRASATGNGYWLLGGDGGVFSFGDAFFFGSNPGLTGANAAIDLVVRA